MALGRALRSADARVANSRTGKALGRSLGTWTSRRTILRRCFAGVLALWLLSMAPLVLGERPSGHLWYRAVTLVLGLVGFVIVYRRAPRGS